MEITDKLIGQSFTDKKGASYTINGFAEWDGLTNFLRLFYDVTGQLTPASPFDMLTVECATVPALIQSGQWIPAPKQTFTVICEGDTRTFIDAINAGHARQIAVTRYGKTPIRVLPYRTREFVAKRYPNLIKSCKWVATLCDSEAVAGIADYLNGWPGSSEAVNHYGGTKTLIQYAIGQRPATRRPATV